MESEKQQRMGPKRPGSCCSAQEEQEMANKFIPKDKMSKKKRRAEYAKRRGSWNGVSPETRVMPNKKAYDRNRARNQMRREAQDV